MNLKKTLIMLTVIVFSVSMFAHFESFRFVSTAGILNGDIEYILIPGEMVTVEGFNVYTNLSNFDGAQEFLLDPAASDDYLIGTKFNYNDIHFAVLHASRHEMDRWIGTYVVNYYEDIIGNTEYDFHYLDSMNGDDLDVIAFEETYVGIAYGSKETMRIGFSYFRNSTKLEYDWNFTEQYNEYNVETDEMLLDYYRNDNLIWDNNDVYQTFLLSFYQPVSDILMGFNLYYAPSVDHEQMFRVDTINEDFAPGATATSYINTIDQWQDEFIANTNVIGGDLVVKQDKEDYCGMAKVSYSYAMGPRTERYYEDGIFYLFETGPTAIDNWTYQEDFNMSTHDTLGTYMETGMHRTSIGIKYIKKTEKVWFGGAAQFSMSAGDTLRMLNYETIYTETSNDGNGIDDGGDYTIVETGSYSVEEIGNIVTHSINLPVGVEFFANKSLCFRLGANTSLTWNNEFHSEKYSAYAPEEGIITFGDGTFAEYIVEDPSWRDDYEETYHGFTKRTNYYYGLGWTISENFWVDIMAFSDLTDLSGWEISANAKF